MTPITSPIPTDAAAHAREDELLAVRCQLGERAAFDELIRRWHVPLWRYVRRMAGDDDRAGDMVQDVWLRVVRGIVRLRDPARVRAWLFGIARRVAMDRLREQYAAPPFADAGELEDVADVTGDAGLEKDLDAVNHEIARLPVLEREVLTLFYLKELSLAEVGDVLGVPVGTVKSRLFRARRMLRRELTHERTSRS